MKRSDSSSRYTRILELNFYCDQRNESHPPAFNNCRRPFSSTTITSRPRVISPIAVIATPPIDRGTRRTSRFATVNNNS